MAIKTGDPTCFREQDVAAKPFTTDYYVDIRRASLATPEFMHRALME